MRWKPDIKFAVPGVVALFLAALLQGFIPQRFRAYVFASVLITLVLGLITGQFRQMAPKNHKDKKPEDQRG